MREYFFQRKYSNLLIPESAEVDRRHQPSDEDRDKRCLKKQHQKVQKRGEKSEKVPLGMRSLLGPFCCCTLPSGRIEEQFIAAI